MNRKQWYEYWRACRCSKKGVEIWKDIDGFNGVFQVSNLSRVRSKDRIIFVSPESKKQFSYVKSGHIIKDKACRGGYRQVSIAFKAKSSTIRLNRLVAKTFIPNSNKDKNIVDHIDTVRDNNILYNLRWCTQKENLNNPITKKRMSQSMLDKKAGKKVIQYDINMNIVNVWQSAFYVHKQLGYDSSYISKCCRGKAKTHKGYKWSFA